MVSVRLRASGVRTHGVGFGHLNAALSRLVIQSVTDVVAAPIDVSVYEKDKLGLFSVLCDGLVDAVRLLNCFRS